MGALNKGPMGGMPNYNGPMPAAGNQDFGGGQAPAMPVPSGMGIGSAMSALQGGGQMLPQDMQKPAMMGQQMNTPVGQAMPQQGMQARQQQFLKMLQQALMLRAQNDQVRPQAPTPGMRQY